MEPIEVIAPGEHIKLDDEIPAQIIGVVIRAGNCLQYEVTWWDGRQRQSKYLYDCELPANPQAKGIIYLSPLPVK